MLWSAFASDAGAVSRFGPMLPVAFAGAKVWHEPQLFEAKTDCPAAAFPPPEDVVVALVEPVVAAEVVVVAEVDPTVTVCTTVEDGFPSDV
jgi:hypothetical protein